MADHFPEQSVGGLKTPSIDLLATDKTQYFAQPHSIIIIIHNYCELHVIIWF